MSFKTDNGAGYDAEGFNARPAAGPHSEGLMKQYFSEPTRAYAAMYGDIADNVYTAQCQGLIEGDFFAWREVLLRSANTEFTGYSSARPDDTQRIYILRPETVVYIPAGALMKYGGSTWLVMRTRNLGTPRGSAILRRCNAVTNVLLNGELTPVPLVLETPEISAAAPYVSSVDMLAAGQLKAYCQRCPATDSWQENTRIILGRSAFCIRGMNDFTRELTDEPDSARVLSFTLQRTLTQPSDSIEQQCANYDRRE